MGNNIIEDKRVINDTALTALDKVVENTPYSTGIVEDFENNNINFYFISSLAGLNDIVDTYKCEFKTRVIINALGIIQAKYIDLVHRLGNDTGLRFTYDINVNSIERTTSDDNHFNVLYGRGSSLETEDGGYSRKITFQDVAWTTPENPINKPLGQKFIEDAESIKKYGRLEGLYENDKINNPEILLKKTYEKLQEVKDLNYSYVVNAEDLRNFEGFEHYKYTFGDSIIVLDEDENITVEARILEITKEVDLINNAQQIKITLGNYRNGLIENEDDIKDVIDNIKDKIDNITDNELNDSEFPDTLPDAPTISGKGLFATIMLEWSYENKMYYTYELFASKIKDFSPGPTNKIFEGKASAFLHEVNPEETWYYRARAKNTHDHYTDYSTQLAVSTYKISDSANYFEEAAIKDATIGELKLDRGWVGKLVGNHIDARNLTVTDGNGKKTLEIDSFGRVKLDVTSLKISANNVPTFENVKDEIQNSINNYKDTVNKELDDIKDAMDNLGDTLDEAFKDGIINEAEAIAIKQQIQNLEIEKKAIDSVYNSLYSNVDLTGTAKNNLYNAKASYNTAHTNLINAINDAIADKKISTDENTLVKRAFANYGTALATFRTRNEEALDAIANKKKQDAIQYTDTQFNILDGKIQSKITSVDAQSIAEQTVNGFKKKVEATYPTNESVSNSFANLDRNLQNTYATKTLVDQTANSITQTVSKKVGKNEIISSINQTAESVKISASKFEIDGTTLLNGQMKMLPTRGSTNYASLYAIKNGNGVNMRVQLGGTQQDGCFEIVSGSEAKYFWVNYQGAHSSNYHYFHTDSSNVGYNVDCLLENGCFRPMVDNKGYLGTQRHYWNQSWITNMYSRTLTTSSDVAIGGDINLSGSLIARYGNIHGNYIGSYGNIMANGTVKGNYLESTGSAKIASNLQVDNTATIKSTVYIGGSLEVKSYGTTLKELEVTSTTTLKGYTVIKNNSLGVEGFIYCNGNIEALQSGRGQINCNYLGSMGNIACRGTLSGSNLSISGSKNCVQETQNYGKRLVNAYETADYLFGDVGESTIENGECIVYLDDIFKEVITTDITYQVFLTKYGKGDIWVSERHSDYFVVQAENDISFGWEIKGKRKGYENYRLEEYVEENKYAQENNTI